MEGREDGSSLGAGEFVRMCPACGCPALHFVSASDMKKVVSKQSGEYLAFLMVVHGEDVIMWKCECCDENGFVVSDRTREKEIVK